MKDAAPPDALDALCLAAGPRHERRRDLEAELARQRVLARFAGREADVRARLGRFEITRCIGRGGMGTVFAARDCQLGTPVALKVLHDPPDQALARLKREFRALRDVNHPQLVAMYELHIEDDLPFFTMELIDGPALSQRLREVAPLDAGFVTRLMLLLCDALAALHGRGTVHGDIKPSNILVQRGGRPMLVDFGVARSLGDSRSASASGTPAYWAPERLLGVPADAAGDWYALGVVLHELLERVSVPGAAPDAEVMRGLRALCAGLRETDPRLRSGAREIIEALGGMGPDRVELWPDQEAAFVGRELELARLQRSLATVVDRPVVCTLSGEAGIGKTALVERFLASLESRVLVLRGRCYEDESLPYKGIEGLIEDLAVHLESLPAAARAALVPHDTAALLQVFPSLRCLQRASTLAQQRALEEPRRARRLAFGALTELLTHVARARPLVLFLDDLQWGDADGAALLQHLLAEPTAPALLVIGSFRNDAVGPCVHVLRTAAAEPLHSLGPLALEACDNLARQLFGRALHPQQRDRVMRDSGGSPLLLHALLRAGPALAEGPRDYAQLITNLFTELDGAARELLVLVTLAGCPVDLTLLGAAAETSVQPRKWLPSLRSQRLVRTVAREAGLALLPHHDRIREVVTATLSPEERQRSHARLARAATQIGLDDPEFLANHHFRAHELAAAAPYAERAGDRARATMALDRARELYARALACHAPERPVSLLEKLADVAAAAGDLQSAAPLYREALAAQPEQDWRLGLRAAEVYLLRGAEREGMSLLRPAMRKAGIPVPSTMTHAVLLGALSLARCHLARERTTSSSTDDLHTELSFRIGYMVTLHDPKGVALVLWSAARALRRGSAAQQGRALATLAHVYWLLRLCTPAEQDAMVERALALTHGVALPHACALACKALIAFGRSECDLALATLDHVGSLIVEQRVDAQWLLAQVHTLVASVAVLAGDFQRIRSMAEGLERDALEQGNRTVLAQIQSSRAWASLAAGDPTHMQRYAAAARAEWRSARLTPLYGIAVWGECHRLLFLDQTAAAHALMQEEAPRFVRAGLARTQMWTIPLGQMWGNVELACSRAPGDTHFRAAERHAQRLERDPSLWGQACGALLRAGLARRAGQTDRAERSYSAARHGYARLGMAGCAAAAAYRERQIVGERALLDELSWFSSQAVAEPASWVRMFAP